MTFAALCAVSDKAFLWKTLEEKACKLIWRRFKQCSDSPPELVREHLLFLKLTLEKTLRSLEGEEAKMAIEDSCQISLGSHND
jgi:hypothetical protein